MGSWASIAIFMWQGVISVGVDDTQSLDHIMPAAHRLEDAEYRGCQSGLGIGVLAADGTTLEAIMRVSITVACVAVFAAFPLFSLRAVDLAEARRIEDQLARTRHRVDDVMLNSSDAKELVKKSRIYIARAETALANNHLAFARPLSEAADALARAVDHVVRARDVTRTDYPTRQRVADRLNTVDLRVKQASYFQKRGGDSTAKGLIGLAQRYNERAREAYRNGKRRETDEYSTTADEIIRALEYIAQAQT